MKKLIVLFLAASMTASLTACGGSGSDSAPAETSVSTETSIESEISSETASVEETVTESLSETETGTDSPEAASSPEAELLNSIYSAFAEDQKFPIGGGDSENLVMDGPGAFDITKTDELESSLGFPAGQADSIDGAASMIHMMNANTFTCGAYHLSDDVSAADVASSLRDNIMNRQWMCGFPDKLVVITMGQFVVSVYGAEDLVDTFRDKLQNCFSSSVVVYDEPIA